jgi:hypothetical protein
MITGKLTIYSVLKREIGCSRVIAWNSVCRRNEPDKVQLKHVERQQAPEKGFVPTSRLQPIAGFAHVDQDAVSPCLHPVVAC